jgi:hypothetical protein
LKILLDHNIPAQLKSALVDRWGMHAERLVVCRGEIVSGWSGAPRLQIETWGTRFSGYGNEMVAKAH